MAKEKPKVKNAQPDTLVGEIESFGSKAMRKLFGLGVNWQKRRDILKNNYDLGVMHLARGNVSDAILRFRMVTWLDPNHPDAWYHLGRGYLADGKNGMARKALTKALQLKPDSEEAHYLLAIATGKAMPSDKLPRRTPLSLALAHFESIAPSFTREQIETYQYSGHTKLCAAILETLGQSRVNNTILELGTGTGLCGPYLRGVAGEMAGVDFSETMLAEAMRLQNDQGRKIYDALFKREIQDFLQEAPEAAYDVIYSASTFSYIGDLQMVFHHSARALKPGGIFAFTADKMDGEGFRLDTEGARFLFSESYLRDLLERSGLSILRFEEAEAYPGYKVWLCVATK